MDVKVLWDSMIVLYQHVLHKRCICYVNSKTLRQMLDEIFGNLELRNVPEKNATSHELQLLSSTVIQLSVKPQLLAGESYICKGIASLAEHVISDQFFDTQVHHLINNVNKFLQRAVLRSLPYSLYLLDEDKFSNRVMLLLDLLKSSTSENTLLNLLNLLELIMDCTFRSVHVLEPHNVKCPPDEKSACKNQVQLKRCSLDDLKFKCYIMLSSNWEDLVKKIFNKTLTDQNKVFIAFLCLWKSCLKAACESKVSRSLFFNNEQLIDVFVSLTPTEPVALRIFLEVLIQSLSLEDSLLSCGRMQNRYHGGKHMISAINSGFLANLPVGEYKSGFGGAFTGVRCKAVGMPVIPSCDKSIAACNEVIVKKIVYISLKILSVSKISASLLTAFWNTEIYLRSRILVNIDTPAYMWILDLFFDEDDLLIDTLLCSLSLYMNLESTEKIDDVPDDDVIKLRGSLNPHKAFINFLQRIGGDHHVLLDFLISSDTHILNYLMQYLKLCISEWEQFLSAHEAVKTCRIHSHDGGTAVVHLEENICDEKRNSVTDDSDLSLNENSRLLSSVFATSEHLKQGHLVSYSSSSMSSSDSELSLLPTRSPYSLCSCEDRISPDQTISILANLRQALEKLVRRHEFPYRVDPLIELLRKCENMNKR